jgi:hypothetical protein
MIDHITFTTGELDVHAWDAFMSTIGFQPFEIPIDSPQYAYELEQFQRWYTDGGECDIHIVQNPMEEDEWHWGHICINSLTRTQYEDLRDNPYCVRDNDSGRIWLQGPDDFFRVEVREPA